MPFQGWAVVPAYNRIVLEKIKGQTLLAIAISKFEGEKNIRRVVVGTDSPDISKEAVRAGATLPAKVFVKKTSNDLRDNCFDIIDCFVEENLHRIHRWDLPETLVAIDPFHPFVMVNTVNDIVQDLRDNWSTYPVIEVLPGLVQTIGCMMGHWYSPKGIRPHENYREWERWSRETYTVGIVPISVAAEAFRVDSTEAVKTVDAMSRGRAFQFNLAMDYSTMYVPSGKSWGAFTPLDADFVYDAAHDRRVIRPRK